MAPWSEIHRAQSTEKINKKTQGTKPSFKNSKLHTKAKDFEYALRSVQDATDEWALVNFPTAVYCITNSNIWFSDLSLSTAGIAEEHMSTSQLF